MKQRINKLKQAIGIFSKNDHINITCKLNGKVFKAKTNIHDNLTRFEHDAVIVHIYKLIDECYTRTELRKRLDNTNYAEVFGGPWNLDLEYVAKY